MSEPQLGSKSRAWLAESSAEQLSSDTAVVPLRDLLWRSDELIGIAAWSEILSNPSLGPTWAVDCAWHRICPQRGADSDLIRAFRHLTLALAPYLITDEGLTTQAIDLALNIGPNPQPGPGATYAQAAVWRELALSIARGDRYQGLLPPLLSGRAGDVQWGLTTRREVWAALMASYRPALTSQNATISQILQSPSAYRWPELTPGAMMLAFKGKLGWNFMQGQLHPAVCWWISNDAPELASDPSASIARLEAVLDSLASQGNMGEIRQMFLDANEPPRRLPRHRAATGSAPRR